MGASDPFVIAYLVLRIAQSAACLALAAIAIRRLRALARSDGMPGPGRGLALGALLFALAAVFSVFDLWDNLVYRASDSLSRSSWLWLAFDLLFPVVGFLLLRAQAERDAALARLSKLAITDELTGLLNRRGFLDAAAARAAAAARMGRPLALVGFDLDRFKSINDGHGHAAGDAVLRGAAEAVRAALRRGDIAGRIGGEEFCLLLDPAETPTAVATAERLRAALATVPHPRPGARVTASFGVAPLSARDTTPEAALEAAMAAADAAVYRAKAAGRDRVEAATTAVPAEP